MPALGQLKSLLPLHCRAPFSGWDWAGSCRSALEVSGDFYDVVALSESSLLLVIADVMGKGAPAAFFADALRTLVRALAKPGLSPAALLSEANGFMFEDLSSADVFITAQLVVADLFHRRLLLASAGHCPVLVGDPYGRTRSISAQGMPLGIQGNTVFHNQSAILPAFGSVLLYTDGITEARDAQGRFFGQERLEGWLSRSVPESQTAAELKAGLLSELSAFQPDSRVADDQTFVLLLGETPRGRGAGRAPCSWLNSNWPWLAIEPGGG